MAFGKPDITSEANLGGRINESLEPKNMGLTPGRIATVNQLTRLQNAGAMVDMTPTMNQIDDHIIRLQQGGVGPDARVALSKLKALQSDINTKYLASGNPSVPPKVAVTPMDADYINQQLQDAIGGAYGRPGGKASVRALKSVAATHTSEFRNQTGTQQTAATTQARLDAIDAMRKQISETAPESFVRGVGDALQTHGESGDQSALLALRAFDPSGELESQIRELSSQREWTSSQSRIAHNIKWEFVRRLPRFAAKLTGISARPFGTGAAAVTAFSQAMSQPDTRQYP